MLHLSHKSHYALPWTSPMPVALGAVPCHCLQPFVKLPSRLTLLPKSLSLSLEGSGVSAQQLTRLRAETWRLSPGGCVLGL